MFLDQKNICAKILPKVSKYDPDKKSALLLLCSTYSQNFLLSSKLFNQEENQVNELNIKILQASLQVKELTENHFY